MPRRALAAGLACVALVRGAQAQATTCMNSNPTEQTAGQDCASLLGMGYRCGTHFCATCTEIGLHGMCDQSCSFGLCAAATTAPAPAPAPAPGPASPPPAPPAAWAATPTATCADVQTSCSAFIASGQYSCAANFCPTCTSVGQCDLTCVVCSVIHALVDVSVIATDGVAGFTTYRLSVNLPATAANVYIIAGTATSPLHVSTASLVLPERSLALFLTTACFRGPLGLRDCLLSCLKMPAAYQCDTPFGQHLGGVSPVMWAIANTDALGYAQYDSWLTIGPDDGSYVLSTSPVRSQFEVHCLEHKVHHSPAVHQLEIHQQNASFQLKNHHFK